MVLYVVGAGATGTLFAARLSEAGHAVQLIDRTARVAGSFTLTVEGERPGEFTVDRAPAAQGGPPADGVLLAVKTFDLAAAAASVARSVAPAPTLAPQNGLGVETLAERGLTEGGWPHPRTVLVRAIHSIPATWLGPGRVRQAGDGEFVLPAEGAEAAPAVDRWAEWVKTMGYRVRRVPDFPREVWRKVLVNAAINPVTADLRVPNGRLREDPWRGQALRLLEEARAVAAAEGQAFTVDEAEADLWKVVRATAQNHSSMLQDIERGRPTEVEAISGEIVARADHHGIPVPATRRALQRLRERGRQATGPARGA